MHKVYIVSACALTPGRHYGKGFRDLAAEAFLKAWEKAGNPEIDVLILASAFVDVVEEQLLASSYVCEYLSLENIPSIRIETGDSSSSSALVQAFNLVKAGVYDTVAVVSVEKVTDFISMKVNKVLSYLCDSTCESYYGVTPAVHAALMTREYMRKFGYNYEDIAWWSVKMHERGCNNPYASLRRKLSIDDIMNSEVVADPIRLFDTALPVDGACCLIISSKRLSDASIEVVTALQYAYNVPFNMRSSYSTLFTLSKAKKLIDDFKPTIFEISDKFSIFGLLALEALGLAETGKAPRLVKEGAFDPGRQVVVNASGGLKCIGYVAGASGAYLATMLYMELLNEKPFDNVGNHQIGAVCDIGGTDRVSNVLILRRES